MSATFPLSLPLPAHNKQLECVGLLLLTGCPSCPECLQELRVTAAAESRSRSKPLLCTLVCGEHNNDDDDVPRNGTHSIGAIFLYPSCVPKNNYYFNVLKYRPSPLTSLPKHSLREYIVLLPSSVSSPCSAHKLNFDPSEEVIYLLTMYTAFPPID